MREIKQVVYSYNELSPSAQDKARYDFVNGSNRYVVEWKLKALLNELFGEGFNDCLEAEYAFNAGKKSGLNVYGKVPVRMLLSILNRTARMAFHSAFAKKQKQLENEGYHDARSLIYRELAGMMNIPAEKCHGGMFSAAECRRAIRLLLNVMADDIAIAA